jgi:hypothetical protein
VHTQNGPVPIEKIRVGDFVLSQPETKGELVYRKVVNTFVHEDKEVILIDYSLVGESVDEIDEVTFWDNKNESNLSYLVATGNHPFWVRNVGWTAAAYLATNQVLELKDGTSAVVLQTRIIRRTITPGIGWCYDMDEDTARKIDLRDDGVVVSEYDRVAEVDEDFALSGPDSRLRARAYNVEVDGFHTYYVGENGVWVHNANFPGTTADVSQHGNSCIS